MKPIQKNIFLALFFISGTCGLIYEIIWSRLLVFVFGGTTFAITTVLACFMGGLAFGSWLAGRLENKLTKPAKIYGVLEIGIGIYCLLIPTILEAATPVYKAVFSTMGSSLPVMTATRVFLCMVILLLPTSFMGATLPLLVKAFTHKASGLGKSVSKLYGINTLGAFTGTMLAGFLLLPNFGFTISIAVAASMNISAGIIALFLSTTITKTGSEIEGIESTIRDPATNQTFKISHKTLLLLYALSGFAAMAWQIAWTRSLILSLGSSVYAFSMIVSCYIFGLGFGSLVSSRWVDRLKHPINAAGILSGTIALSALLVAPGFGALPVLIRNWSSDSAITFQRLLTYEFLLVFVLLAIPTLCMGALMPIVCRLYNPPKDKTARSVGNVYASNTFGTILGALVAGFFMIPAEAIGMQTTINIMACLTGIIATTFLIHEAEWRKPVGISAICIIWICSGYYVLQSQEWSKSQMASGPFLGELSGGRDIVYYREGIDTTVAVAKAPKNSGFELIVNGKTDASTHFGDMYTQYMLGYIPMMLHKNPKDVFIIGLGSGGTAHAALSFKVNKIDIAEISKGVIDATPLFKEINNRIFSSDQIEIHRSDGRNYLLLTDKKYDVIISEPSNPWISGIANLFTKEFFEIAKGRLKPSGLHCQWIHSYSMNPNDFGAVLKTFNSVFPQMHVWQSSTNDYLLIGSEKPIDLDIKHFKSIFAKQGKENSMNKVFIFDPFQMANHYVTSGEQLSEWLEDKQMLIDNQPYLEFNAPKNLLKNYAWIIQKTLYEHAEVQDETVEFDSPDAKEFNQRLINHYKSIHSVNAAYKAYKDGNNEEIYREFQAALRFSNNDMRLYFRINKLLKKRGFFSKDPLNQEKVDILDSFYLSSPHFKRIIEYWKNQDTELYFPFSAKKLPVTEN